MPERNNVYWTAMIGGYAWNEFYEEALIFLRRYNLVADMQTQRVSPLDATYAVLLGAAGAMAYLDQSKQFHGLLGFSHHGLSNEALIHFEAMQKSGINLNSVIYWALYQHATMKALSIEGWNYFRRWTTSIQVNQAELGVARSAAKWLLELDPLSALAHMVQCHMYAATGQHGD
ncbi:hypothetical protein RJ639_006458 [Escallonia herrerae]|uniref:Uncharacterized protein n=1 Tax=Escallonia herrerae TaxID=1293975 RepID=A0AA89AVG8_9ASTE|nr:hypothetical protein RJ639_006458 [Escallonia herrerae]